MKKETKEIITPLQIREATITYHLKSISGEQLKSDTISDQEIIELAAQFKASLERLNYYKFCFYQAETSTEGNLHFQCYAQLGGRIWNTKLIKDLPGGFFLKARGSPAENMIYCSKKTDPKTGRYCYRLGPWIYGHPTLLSSTSKGGRPKTSQQECAELIKLIETTPDSDKLIKKIKKDYPGYYFHYKEKITKHQIELHPVEIIDKKRIPVWWFYGIAGSGKSTHLHSLIEQLGLDRSKVCWMDGSSKSENKLWFLPGDQHKTVLVIEETRIGYPDHFKLVSLINGHKLQTKGGFIQNNFQLIIFVSILPPWEIYKKVTPAHRLEVLRRIHKVTQVAKNPISFSKIDPNKEYGRYELARLNKPLIFDETPTFSEKIKELILQQQSLELEIVNMVRWYRLLVVEPNPDFAQLTEISHYLTELLTDYPGYKWKLKKLVEFNLAFSQQKYDDYIADLPEHAENQLSIDDDAFCDYYPHFSLTEIVPSYLLNWILRPNSDSQSLAAYKEKHEKMTTLLILENNFQIDLAKFFHWANVDDIFCDSSLEDLFEKDLAELDRLDALGQLPACYNQSK